MSLRSLLSPFLPRLLGAFALAWGLGGCEPNQEEEEAQDRYFKTEPQEVPEARANRLGDEPTAFLRSRAADPIHWQPWSRELFEHSQLEQKPVFAVVGAGNYPAAQVLLDRISAQPQTVQTLHSHYLCTLVDIHAHPEVALYSFLLAQEIRRAVHFPFLIWLSHERHPIAWLPLATAEITSFEEVFANSHEMIKQIWKDDPRYVVNNSRSDNEARFIRLQRSLKAPAASIDLPAARQKAGRDLSALFNPTSGHIDHSGGLPPFTLLQFAGALAAESSTPPDLKDRLVAMVQGHANLLLTSAIYDPLDGGFFQGRRTRGWDLPIFVKNSGTQLEGILALAKASQIMEGERYLRAAQDVLDFTETRFGDEQKQGLGIFENPVGEEALTQAYLWSRDKLREFLPAEEFPVVEQCFGIRKLGNIPLESDQKRLYFRLNSLSAARSPEEVSPELGLTEARARELLDSARQRLLGRRRELLDVARAPVEPTQLANLNARYATAVLEAGIAADDPELIAKARVILENLRASHYSEEQGLMRIPPVGGRRGIRARGLDYATLLEALFRIYRHDLDPAHLVWAHQLGIEALELLADEDGLLLETPGEERIVTLPLFNTSMIFGNSTWGIICGPLKRLHQLTGSERLAETLAALEPRLLTRMQQIPLVHTDFGATSSVAQADTLVYLDGPRGSEAFSSLHQALRQPEFAGVSVVHLHPSLPSAFNLPEAGDDVGAIVIRGGKMAGEARSAEELRSVLKTPAPVE